MLKTKERSEKSQGYDSHYYLNLLEDRIRIQENRFSGVQTVLVVLSSRAMTFDVYALTQKILFSYPDAAVFFKSTSGIGMGLACPDKVDLLIDFTGPRQRQGLFYSRKLRRMARFAVGRNAGFFRKGSYDRIIDEKILADQLPKSLLECEAFVQKRVLALAGVPTLPIGLATEDKSTVIATELPPLSH